MSIHSFYDFSVWVYSQTKSTWQISLFRLAELLFTYLMEKKGKSKTDAANLLFSDLAKIEGRKIPGFIKDFATITAGVDGKILDKKQKRQIMHL